MTEDQQTVEEAEETGNQWHYIQVSVIYRIYHKYWDTLTAYHTCPMICKSLFLNLLMCLINPCPTDPGYTLPLQTVQI